MVLRSNSHGGTAKVLCNGVHITRLQHGNPVKWATKVLPSVVLRSCHTRSWWYPNGNLIMSGTLISDWWCGTLAVRFGGTARILQNNFAVTQIVILQCIQYHLAYKCNYSAPHWHKDILCDFFILTLEQIIVLNKYCTYLYLCNSVFFKRRLWSN